jgi:hypothetical protein
MAVELSSFGNSAIPFGVFESGIHYRIFQIDLFLLHRHQLPVHGNPVSLMIRIMLRKYSGAWNSIRCCSDHSYNEAETALRLDRKFHPGARVAESSFLRAGTFSIRRSTPRLFARIADNSCHDFWHNPYVSPARCRTRRSV